MYGVYTSYQKKQRTLHIALLAMSLIVIGYTTYTTGIIRSNANPPMNENNPSHLARLVSYLGREQYGDAPFWPRRYSQEPQDQGIYTNYTSEMDFLWRYQLHHMFTRYLLWNYAGTEGDWQDARANLFPFNGGVKPAYNKEQSNRLPIADFWTEAPLPAELVIPLHQSIGGTPHPLVHAGDQVKKGQLIGGPDGNVSSAVHAGLRRRRGPRRASCPRRSSSTGSRR